MISHICSKCDGEFPDRESIREHFKQCEEIPDCNRCGESFEDREVRRKHVYEGGCPYPLEMPPQPPQDRLYVEGRYQGSRSRIS